MALLLRQACQPALDNADLDSYHADLDATHKTFKLYTPCGKTFATVSGVLFSSLRPTKAEIDFAVELLGDWLLRNNHLIDKFIKEFTILDKIGELNPVRDNMQVYFKGNYNLILRVSEQSVDHVSFGWNEVTFTFAPDGSLRTLTWPDVLPDWRKVLKLPAKQEQTALAFMAEHVHRQAQQNIVDGLLTELNTCVS